MHQIVCSILLLGLLISLPSCQESKKSRPDSVAVVGAMKAVMWEGKLGGQVRLDTLRPRQGLYGLGPEKGLTGELLLVDGQAFVSRVQDDTLMIVQQADSLEAPFFVYGHVNDWVSSPLPPEVLTGKDLEQYLDQRFAAVRKPFVFKLQGTLDSAQIHIQNLPPGTRVSSPKEAHQGQVNYQLGAKEVEIIGFFSRNHQGIFTHHDSYIHMHLLTQDHLQMGHLDVGRFRNEQMTLFLPEEITH